MRSFTGTHPGPDADGAPAPYYFIVALAFDDEAAHDAALGGREGQAAVADLENFAGAGVTIVSGPTISYQ